MPKLVSRSFSDDFVLELGAVKAVRVSRKKSSVNPAPKALINYVD